MKQKKKRKALPIYLSLFIFPLYPAVTTTFFSNRLIKYVDLISVFVISPNRPERPGSDACHLLSLSERRKGCEAKKKT